MAERHVSSDQTDLADPGVLDFNPPSAAEFWRWTAPLRAYFRPRFFGLENIRADKPTLLVGNHTIYGILDAPQMIAKIYKENGVLVRALADHAHFDVPVWRDVLKKSGGVDGTRPNCRALMASGAHILVFPGGGREVAKRKGEEYQLTWKNRTGFARMAIENGYSITPFASLGPDDALDIVWDANDIMDSPLGYALRRSGLYEGPLRDGDMIMPIARGVGLSMLPRPERFYFGFGKPISTRKYQGMQDDPEALMDLRGRTERAIKRELKRLEEIRKTEDTNSIFSRIVSFKRRKLRDDTGSA